MAHLADRLQENAPGPFFVDSSCIDCDTCRQIAPDVFAQARSEKSFVHHQPEGPAELHRATMALVACPTSSIGTVGREHKGALPGALSAFPELVDGDVSYCGFAAESSFGASSYFVRRPGGNVLVDSPRAAGPLMNRLEALGGVSFMFLSHRDDVADHAQYRARFGCERILHERDVTPGTREVEVRLTGDETVRLADDLLAIPVPGHTRGSTALLYKDTYLFTGDHLWWSAGRNGLIASRSVCWYSWSEQVRSLERLLDHPFEWVLPGHGRRFHASPASMRAELERLLAFVKSRPG